MTNALVTTMFILATTFSLAQERVLYHAGYASASFPVLTKWNVGPAAHYPILIRETIDSLNRVVEIAFMHEGHICHDFECGEASIVTYQYTSTSIIEQLWFDIGKLMSADGCDAPCRVVYHLDKRARIISEDMSSLIQDTISTLRNVVPSKAIWYFNYSSAKMNGVDPKVAPGIPSRPKFEATPIELRP
jgi:hypothetical protein